MIADISTYVMDAQEKQESLWEFGEYSKTNSYLTPSKAPRISDILNNTNLWLLFIKHFPKMKPKDTDIQAVIEGVMKRVKAVNTSKYDDSIFVWWYRKVCHLQITHIRDLIKYPDRYEYRINQLGDEDAAKFENIRSMAKQVHGSEPEIPQTPAKKNIPSDILTSPETAKWFDMPSGSMEACCRSKRICTSSEPSPKKGIPCMFCQKSSHMLLNAARV